MDETVSKAVAMLSLEPFELLDGVRDALSRGARLVWRFSFVGTSACPDVVKGLLQTF